jgi:hypothetical protein
MPDLFFSHAFFCVATSDARGVIGECAGRVARDWMGAQLNPTGWTAGMLVRTTGPGAAKLCRVAIPERASWVKSSWRHSFLVASPSGFVKCFNWTVGCGWNCGVVVEVFLAGCLQPSFLVGCIPIHPFVIPSA